MVRCKTVLTTIVVVFLLFLGIPIRVDPPKSSFTNNNTEVLFSTYIAKFNKSYRNNDSLKYEKLVAFKESLENVEELNSVRKHNTSARFGFTKYSDMTKEEFLDIYLQDKLYEKIQNKSHYIRNRTRGNYIPNIKNVLKSSGASLPMKIDWRTKGVMSKIKDQKNCGACWAFSTVQTIESMKAVKTGKLEELSVQEVIDCAGYDNDGCDGGDICTLLYWLDDNSVGIQKSEEYPLQWKSETCKLKTNDGVRISDFTCDTFVNAEDRILYLLANHGPVAVAVNALLWQNYLGGVIHYHCESEPVFMNHAVQIVGYDRTAEIPHYIVRNSWGTDFGDKGYLYIAIGSNMCGVANEVVSLDVL